MLPASVRSPRRPYLETVPLETAVRVSICLPPALLFAHVFDERVRVWVGPAAAARGRRRPGASDRGRAADQHAEGPAAAGQGGALPMPTPARLRSSRSAARARPSPPTRPSDGGARSGNHSRAGRNPPPGRQRTHPVALSYSPTPEGIASVKCRLGRSYVSENA